MRCGTHGTTEAVPPLPLHTPSPACLSALPGSGPSAPSWSPVEGGFPGLWEVPGPSCLGPGWLPVVWVGGRCCSFRRGSRRPGGEPGSRGWAGLMAQVMERAERQAGAQEGTVSRRRQPLCAQARGRMKARNA